MKKTNKIISIILSYILTLMSFNFVANAESDYYLNYIENSSRGNIYGWSSITLSTTDKDIYIGYVPAGKIIVVSLIPTDGSYATSCISDIGLWPQLPESNVKGEESANSLMSYYKITEGNTYTLKVVPKANLSDSKQVEVYVYTVDYIDGFSKYDDIEGISGSYNYVISNKPEFIGNTQGAQGYKLNETVESSLYETTLLDGTTRYLPFKSDRKIISSSKTNINLDKDVSDIIEKINSDKKLTLTEIETYYDYLKENNLKVSSTLSAIDTTKLGEYGYYLSKSKVNGNSNIYWEHVTKYGTDMHFGILLQNTSNSSINVTLNKRNYDSYEDSGMSVANAMNSVWYKYFTGVKNTDYSDLQPNQTLTIPANTAKWVGLYTISCDTGYNIFNGQISLSIKNTNGTAYTGENLYCYSFVMSDWVNPSSGQTMYENVKLNINNGLFTRASGAAEGVNDHISGSGNGARLVKNFNGVIDITDDRYSFLLAGKDVPFLNSGELVPLNHAGCASGGSYSSGYNISNSCNYGVIYKLSFDGFNTTKSNQTIKMKLKFNRLTSPNAVAYSDAGVYVTLMCPEFANLPYCTLIRQQGVSQSVEQVVPYTITKNTDFDLYVVVSGMSAMPLEIEFYTE